MRARRNSRTRRYSLLAILFGGALVLAPPTTRAVGATELGQPNIRDEICGAQVLHADGTYENGVMNLGYWVQPPDFGAFAERYEGPATVCAVTLDVANTGEMAMPSPFDVFIWSDSDGIPGVVIAMIDDVQAPMPGRWPDWRRWRLELPAPCPVGEYWWAGYWQQDQGNPFFLCADIDGAGGGRPMTKVWPGLEYPSGWQDIEVVFFPVAALGIGAEVLPEPVPVREQTWGRVKSLYNGAAM